MRSRLDGKRASRGSYTDIFIYRGCVLHFCRDRPYVFQIVSADNNGELGCVFLCSAKLGFGKGNLC